MRVAAPIDRQSIVKLIVVGALGLAVLFGSRAGQLILGRAR